MSKIPFYPENDFGGHIFLEKIDPDTSDVSPLRSTDGAVTAVISLADDDYTPALPALEISLNDVGDEDGHVPGDWSYFFNGGDSNRDALDALDTSGLTLIIKKPDDTLVTQALKYVRVKKMTLAT